MPGLPCPVLSILNQTILIQNRINFPGIPVSSEFPDSRVKIRQAIHFNYSIIIFRIRRQPSRNIQNIYFLPGISSGLSACIIKSLCRDIFQFQRIF